MPTGRVVGIAMGLYVYCMDSDGQAVANPRFIYHIEQRLPRRSRRLSRKSLHHEQGTKPKHHHAARQRAKHNKCLPVTALAPRATQPHCLPTPPAPAAPLVPLDSAALPASVVPPRPRRRRQSANWHTARQVLAKTSVQLPPQREDCARTQASAVVSSHDLIALEDLEIRTLVKHRRLVNIALSDAGWARVRSWVE